MPQEHDKYGRLVDAFTPVDVALAHVGIKEATARNDGVPSDTYMAGRKEPWCMHFVIWCFAALGLWWPGHVPPTKTRANPIARVKTFYEQAKKAGWVVENPRRGDVIIFNSRGDSDAGDGWHTGIVTDVAGGIIHTVEGNLSNAVGTAQHSSTSKRIIGYVRHKAMQI